MRTTVVVVAAVLASLVAASAAQATPLPKAPTRAIITVVGTSDIHGHLDAEGDLGGLPLLGGYLANIRAARAADGGGVLLLDGGDAFQGTLESNLAEGEGVVAAMNRLGYHAMAIGNHDFDYGPVGPEMTPKTPSDDPRGALKARAAQSNHPFLAANIVEEETGQPIAAPHIAPSTMVEVAGVKIGIVGAATVDTPTSTIAANWKGLLLKPLASAIQHEAEMQRGRGATVIALVTHAGLCRHTVDSEEVAQCSDGEIADVVRQLPPGTVDVVVGGHTHMGASVEISGVPIIQGWKYDRGFGRVDLVVEDGKVVSRKMFQPHLLCARVVAGTERCDKAAPAGPRVPATYEGRPIVADAQIAAIIKPYLDRARARRDEKLGVRLPTGVQKRYGEESAFGNLLVDLMRSARPDVDLALNNAGSLRNDLPPGDLTYGQVFEAYPFDNRFAELRMTGGTLKKVLAANLQLAKGLLAVSGVRVTSVCGPRGLALSLFRAGGKPIGDDEMLRISTSDFLALGGDGTFANVPGIETHIEEGTLVREEIIAALRKRGGTLAGTDPALFDPAHRRIDYPGRRPVRCP